MTRVKSMQKYAMKVILAGLIRTGFVSLNYIGQNEYSKQV